MDDSRSVQSAGALASRAALPQQSTCGEFHFVCRMCGGSEYHVETRPGDNLLAFASMCAYQSVGFSVLAGHYSVFTCIRCEASVRDSRNVLRDALIGKLLFAAKHLAECQFTRQRRNGHFELICVECRTPQVADSFLRHKEHCRVGRVLQSLDELMRLDDPRQQDSLQNGAGGFLSLPAASDGGVQ